MVVEGVTVYQTSLEPGEAQEGDKPTGYDLAFFERNGIPHHLAYHPQDRDLATVEARAYAPASGDLTGQWQRTVNVPSMGEVGSFPFLEDVGLPVAGTRVRKVTTTASDGERLAWRSTVLAQRDGEDVLAELMPAAMPIKPGQHVVQEWYKSALGPAVFFAGRFADSLTLNVDAVVGAGPGHNSSADSPPGSTETVTLLRDGDKLLTQNGTLIFNFPVPADPATYELDLHATRSVDWTPLATEVDAAWTFPSAAPAGGEPVTDLPLPTLRITGDVDDHDRAPAGKSFDLDLTLDGWQGVAPAPAKSMTLQASFDDGQTWQPVQVSAASDGHWTASLDHPAAAQYVSLRAAVESENGIGLKQTVIRAYALGGQADG